MLWKGNKSAARVAEAAVEKRVGLLCCRWYAIAFDVLALDAVAIGMARTAMINLPYDYVPFVVSSADGLSDPVKGERHKIAILCHITGIECCKMHPLTTL